MAGENGEKPERKPPYSVETIPGTGEIAYNVDEECTPDGMKVRWKIRIAKGKEGERVAARQAEAIREILQWAAQYQQEERARQGRARRGSRRSR